jgi:hypothetical protein
VYPTRTNIGTSSGQAVVPINKHIQTIANNKNIDKQRIFKNSSSLDLENGGKQITAVPYLDNLKTSKDKDYNEPL